jgi:hypothetical protein
VNIEISAGKQVGAKYRWRFSTYTTGSKSLDVVNGAAGSAGGIERFVEPWIKKPRKAMPSRKPEMIFEAIVDFTSAVFVVRVL